MISAPQTDPKRGILLMLLAVLLFTAMDALAKGLVPRSVWLMVPGAGIGSARIRSVQTRH